MTNDDTHNTAQNDKSIAADGGTTRRSVLKGAAAATTGLALGSSMLGTSAARDIPVPKLERDGNLLRDPCGNKVILRGVNIIDPARAQRGWRGATADQMWDMATSGDWENHVIRLPMQPQDISGADQRDTSNDSFMIHGENWGPALPKAFTDSELETYLTDYVDPLVDKAKSTGTYIQLDYHRHMPIFHQPQYGGPSGFSGCGTGSNSFPADQGMCGERGVLWHGADQVSDLKALEGSPSDAFYETETGSESVNHNAGANVAEALDKELTDFWTIVANRYAGKNHVLFDVYNEPTGPYAGDWGSPDRAPGGGDTVGINTDVVDPIAKPFWELFLERTAPWVQIVQENAPGSVKTIGSPRWSQYTYWAKDTEIDDVGSSINIDNMCYTGHRYTHGNLQPMSEYFGTAAEQVPVMFNEWGWAAGGGADNFPFLDGSSEAQYPSDVQRKESWPPKSEKTGQVADYESFFDNYPVHPMAWCFDHTWEPAFYKAEAFDTLKDYNYSHAQWWQTYLQDNADSDVPQDPSSADCSTTPPSEEVMDLNDTGNVDFDDVVLYNERRNSQSNPLDPAVHDYNDNQEAGDFDDLVEIFAATQ